MKLLSCILSLLLLAQASPAQAKFHYRRNKVVFRRLQSASTDYSVQFHNYTVKDFRISPGQDPVPHNRIGDVHHFKYDQYRRQYLSFEMGRHKTLAVADWWNQKVGPRQNTFAAEADRLNFAFIGDLAGVVTREGESHFFNLEGFALAQGHLGVSNNWWLGSTDPKIRNFLDEGSLKNSIVISLGKPNVCFRFVKERLGNALFFSPDVARVTIDDGNRC